MFDSRLLEGARILVTGGGTGLGRSMAERFLELGANVLICGRRTEVLEATAAELVAKIPDADVRTYVCDIRSGDAVAEMMKRIWDDGPLDVLVNNAAATFIAQTHRLSHRAADAVLAPTLHGALYCTLEAGRRWIDAKHSGVVLSILSTSTITGRAFTVPSSMAKSAVLAMTKSLAVEWGPRGVRLVAIAPGAFPTPGSAAQLGGGGERRSDISTSNPLGRAGNHAELANLAAFLVSDAGGYINGEMVVIDGGQHLKSSGVDDLLGWSDEKWESRRPAR